VLRHLWAFQIAAEEEQFQLAAERLHIAQSAVSRRIKHLEEQLGVTLFERRSKGAKLTAEGEIFRAEIAQVLNRIDEAVARVRRAALGQVGVLRIGFIELAMRNTALSRAVMQFRARFPDVELTLMPMTSAEVERGVRTETLDIGLHHQNGKRLAEMDYRPVARHVLLLALPKSSPHAQKKSVRLASLGGESFILPSRVPAQQVHDRLLSLFRLAGIVPRVIMEAGTSETMLHMVAAGLGVGFVDSSRRGSEPANVVLRDMADFSEIMQLEMMWKRSKLSSVMEQFIACVPANAGRK
jgi:DNA-binding transcriptional LysR family regulator